MRIKGQGYLVLRAVESSKLVIILRHLTAKKEFKIIHREKIKGRWIETREVFINCRARASNAFIRDLQEAEAEGIRFTKDYPANSVDYRAAGEKAITARATETRRHAPKVTA
jgi:hypothetical protein